MRAAFHLFAILILPVVGAAQTLDPAAWSWEVGAARVPPGGTATARLKAKIDPGWHLYASTTPQGAPNALALRVLDSPAVESWKSYQPKPERQYDPNFEMESEWYVEEAEFLVELRLADDLEPGEYNVVAAARYGVCDDRMCLPPALRSFEATLVVAPEAPAVAPSIPSDYVEMAAVEIPAAILQRAGLSGKTASAAAPAQAESAPTTSAAIDQGLFQFALVALGFGLLAIFTPCVFPMIPITMSYFVSTQSGEPRASLVQATTFALGVVGLFTGLGAAVSALLGPFGMAQIGANVWVNLFIAVVFFAFSASLLGVFEITVPSGAMTRLNSMTAGSGVLPTLVMGLVFALASFACTGPFVGALLAGSVGGGNPAWPIFGMLMFSVGLAAPFFFLALFPSYLKKMPRAGGWMTRVKIAMAFLIAAAGFKYLSNMDQMYQWHLLTRERLLAIWIVLLALDGLYLLGLLRLEDEPAEKVGPARLGLGATALVGAMFLIPGMFGGHLGEIEAYVPAVEYSGIRTAGFGGGETRQKWLKDDYAGALAQARNSGKPILLSFTGYSCTNCKWMKSNMFTQPEIAAAVDELVPVELYTDSRDLDKAEEFQRMQIERFGTAAIPFYALVAPDESTIATFPGRTRDKEAFLGFLRSRNIGSAKLVSRAR